MSESVDIFNLKSAIAYNARRNLSIPSYVLEVYPRLGEPRNTKEFAWATLAAQSDLMFEEHERDGKFGHGTRSALLQMYKPLKYNYIVHTGERLPVSANHYNIVAFDSSHPERMDLHPRGHWSSRSTSPSGVMIHWGGIDAQHCFNVFNSDRKVSSHFLIGLVDSEVTIYQTLDIEKKAWHCGKNNDWTIGIDICQQPTRKWFSLYRDKGYQVEHMNNPTDRGPKKLITLDPRLIKATREFVKDLCGALSLPYTLPSSFDFLSPEEASQYSVLSHAHVSKTKFDIAPWWSMIFDEEEA